jgi:hypothetical protein
MSRLWWSGLIIVLMLSGCGSGGTPTRHNDFTPLTSIEIVAVAPAIAAGSSTRLSVIGNFSGLFTRDITDQVLWSSDSPAVAGFVTASSPSRVTGHSPGTARLTATVGVVSATFELTVSSASLTALTITPAAPTIAKGLSGQFAAIGTFSDSTTQDLTLDVSWASSDPAVATVSDAAGSKGLAQALAAGTTTISATFPFNGLSGTTLLTVTVPVLQSITVTPANPSLLTLSSTSFKATGNFSDGTNADLTSQVAWSSSQSGFASIASGGTATTLTQGTTTISATLGGISGTTTLRVTGGNLTGITLSPVNPVLVNNTVVRMTATGTFSDGASRDITGVVAWSTANSNIATVTSTPGGNLAFLNALAVTPAANPTTVTARSGTLTVTTNLTVKAPLLQSIAITPTSLNLTGGTSDRLTLTATFNDGTTQDVTTNATWTSSVVTIASVGNTGIAKGRVRGVAAGPVTISAAFGNLTSSAPVTVTTRTLSSLTISSAPATVLGNQVKFTVTAGYSDGTSKDVTEDAAWTIDNPFVAILADNTNQPGQLMAVDRGSATLTASFGGKSQTTTVTVP